MTQEELYTKISALANEYNLTLEKIIPIIEKALRQRQSRKEASRDYYAENKKRLDTYHKEYRAKNPQYRQKAAERARRYRR